jgi:hypothetical protein
MFVVSLAPWQRNALPLVTSPNGDSQLTLVIHHRNRKVILEFT